MIVAIDRRSLVWSCQLLPAVNQGRGVEHNKCHVPALEFIAEPDSKVMSTISY